jgi:hypothetical protein
VTSVEVRRGLVRLAVITAGLIAGALVASVLFVLIGARGRAALAAGTGSIGMLLVLSGAAAFTKTSPVRQARAMPDAADLDTKKIREAEHLALGLFAYGIVFSVAALAMG